MSTEMATSKQCSMCNKDSGPIYCTGCDKYFCWKDFKTHREGMLTEMERIIEERNHLQDEINNEEQRNGQQSPFIEQIDKWQNKTIEKVKQVAAQARQQAIQLLNSKKMKVNTEFKSFSQKLVQLKESENYVEDDLTRLNQMINQFKQELRQSTQPTMIQIHTEQSDGINWDSLIYVEEKQTFTNNQQQQQQTPRELPVAAASSESKLECGGRACPECGGCCDWDPYNGWKRRDGATCRRPSDLHDLHDDDDDDDLRRDFLRDFFRHVCFCK